jgi:nickel-dependent lactate racemase
LDFTLYISRYSLSAELFSAPKPLLALSSPPEPFSMDRLKEHIGRVKRVFGIMKDVTRYDAL